MSSFTAWIILAVIVAGFVGDNPQMVAFGIGMAVGGMLMWLGERLFDLGRDE